jgi:hypothetical protein
MTHAELVTRAARWLKKGHGVICAEVACYSMERPDAIGFNHMGTTLVECKVSRADFFRDLKKPHRMGLFASMGSRRYYMCPPGLLKKEDMPRGWGLLYCHPRKIEQVSESAPFESCHYSLMYSLLRRAVLRGFDPNSRYEELAASEARGSGSRTTEPNNNPTDSTKKEAKRK